MSTELFEIGEAPSPKTQRAMDAAYRSSARGKEALREQRRRKSERDYLARPFVAWDGEGVTRVEGGKQDYVLFANSDGAALRTPTGYLSTAAIFRFIFMNTRPGTINVIYGAGYDWNMWFRDFPRKTLERLYKTGECTWEGYWVKWRPGKSLHLGIMGTKDTALFYDVVSFFQSSFVVACEKYIGEDFPHAELIRKNKRLRGSFTAEDLAEIEEYCAAELENLVSLMDLLRQYLHEVGLRVSRWDGPGAIAVALYQRHDIKAHMRRTLPDEQRAVHSAYFGGRFEVCHTGYRGDRVYEYDLNSAYPWALQDVPSLADGTWEEVNGDVRAGDTDFILYYVTFTGASEDVTRPYPLPHRDPKGFIIFPRQTTGWYWGPEVNAAREYVKRYPEATLTIHTSRVFHPASDVKPFAFVEPLYQQRLTYKKLKNGAEKGIKLGLNSMYGKLAQQLGWTIDRNGELRIPPYHQMEWAGYITSRCRAAVYMAVIDDLDSVVAFETDAVFTMKPLKLRRSDALGDWGLDEFSDMAYLQSGTYFATKVSGEVVEKTRGIDRDTMHYADALYALDNGLESVPASNTRFYALGLALSQNYDKWLTWETATKNVSIFPGDKRTHVHEMCYSCSEGVRLRDSMHETYPRSVPAGQVSSPKLIEWLNDGTQVDEEAQWRRDDIERMQFND